MVPESASTVDAPATAADIAVLAQLLRDTADRLLSLEQHVASLASGAGARTAKPVHPDAARLTRRQAAAVLGVSARTVSTYAAKGLLVPLPKSPGSPPGTPTFFDPGNVEALAKGEDSAKEWVSRRKFVPLRKRQ